MVANAGNKRQKQSRQKHGFLNLLAQYLPFLDVKTLKRSLAKKHRKVLSTKRRHAPVKKRHARSTKKKMHAQRSANPVVAASKPATDNIYIPKPKVGEPIRHQHGVFEPVTDGPFMRKEEVEEEEEEKGTKEAEATKESKEEVEPASASTSQASQKASAGKSEAVGSKEIKEVQDEPKEAKEEVESEGVKAEESKSEGKEDLDIAFMDEASETLGEEQFEKKEDEVPKGKKSEDDEKKLRQEVEEEGFLESMQSQASKSGKKFLGALGIKQIGGVFGGAKKPSVKENKKLAKEKRQKEKTEEKEWREEAKRREKLLAERKEKQTQELKEEKQQEGKPTEFRIPKPKKQSGFLAVINSLNYMGLGKQRTSFIDNLATMMDAGLPLLDALHSLQEEASKKPMRKIVGRIIVAIETGSPLWRAMEAQYFFKPQEIAMVRVGEEAGNLVENLQYLAEQEEKDRGLRGKVKTAMIYPIIVLVMLTIIVFGLGLFILPNLIQVLKSLGADLPLTTRVIIAGTELLSENARVIVPSFFGGVIVFSLLVKFTPFKIVVQWVLLHIPGVGPLIREATISRFGVVMGGLLKAGVPVTDALASLVGVTGFHGYHCFYVRLLEQVELGDSFSTSFEKIRGTKRCLPPSVQQLIITGEQSGSLTKVMLKIAEIHEKRASSIAEKLPVILEPMLLLFVGGLVAAIALGVLGPIYSVVGNIGNA